MVELPCKSEHTNWSCIEIDSAGRRTRHKQKALFIEPLLPYHMSALLLTFCSLPFSLPDLLILKKGHSRFEGLYNHVKKGSLLGNRILETSLTSVMPWHLSWGYMQGIIRNNFLASITLVWNILACSNSKVRSVSIPVSSHLSLMIHSQPRRTVTWQNSPIITQCDGTPPSTMLQICFYCGRSSCALISWPK